MQDHLKWLCKIFIRPNENSKYVIDRLDRFNLNMTIAMCGISGAANAIIILMYLFGIARTDMDLQFIGAAGYSLLIKLACIAMLAWCAVVLYIGIQWRQATHQNHSRINALMLVNGIVFTAYAIIVFFTDIKNGNDPIMFIMIEFWLYNVICVKPLLLDLCSGASFFLLRILAGSLFTIRDTVLFAVFWWAMVILGAVNFALRTDQLALREQYRTMNRQLRKDSMNDALTGLRNRRALRRDYELYYSKEITVLMADVDNFKQYNDHYGHQNGDVALRLFGDVLNRCFPKSGKYRYGGDEFLIIAENISATEFENTLKLMRNRLEDTQNEKKKKPFTCSVGYVYGTCSSNEDLREMIHQADGQLYESKSVPGKNRSSSSPYVRGLDVTMTSAVPVLDDDSTAEQHLWM